MLMFHVKELILEIKFKQNLNPKREWTVLVNCSQISQLTMSLNN